MEFKSFAQFLKERGLNEDAHANKEAMEFDSYMQMIRNRFGDMPVDQQEKIVQTAGYKNLTQLAHALKRDPNVWQRIRIPGQENYVGQKNRMFS